MKTLLSKSILIFCMAVSPGFCKAQNNLFKIRNPYYSHTDKNPLKISNTEWKKILKPELYQVAREGATETAFTGKYYQFDEKGTYYCAICGNLFSFQLPNLPLPAAGHRFTSLFVKTVYNTEKTVPIKWSVQKCCVEDVDLTLDMSLMTAQSQPENDSA